MCGLGLAVKIVTNCRFQFGLSIRGSIDLVDVLVIDDCTMLKLRVQDPHVGFLVSIIVGVTVTVL